MARPKPREEWLLERIQRFSQDLAKISGRVRSLAGVISRRDFPGSLRSVRRYGRGIEPEIPRAYRLGDDAGSIDLGRLDHSIAHCPARALLNGTLRVVQSPLDADAEFVAIIDLSRSMLSECFGDALDKTNELSQKLMSLLGGVAVFVALAESAGFPIRVLGVQGRQLFEARCRTPRDFAQRVLSQIATALTRNFAETLHNPLSVEPFSLRRGCAAAVSVPAPAVITIFSDFLDPLKAAAPTVDEGYEDPLRQLLARHQVILIDVSSEEDNSFPEPGRWDFEARRLPCMVGARRIELGMEPRYLTKSLIDSWKNERKEEQSQLKKLIKMGRGQILSTYKLDFAKCYDRAVHAMMGRR